MHRGEDLFHRRSVKYESICTYLEATQRLSSGGWRSLTVRACADS